MRIEMRVGDRRQAIGRVNSNLSRVTLLKLAETILKALPEEATGG